MPRPVGAQTHSDIQPLIISGSQAPDIQLHNLGISSCHMESDTVGANHHIANFTFCDLFSEREISAYFVMAKRQTDMKMNRERTLSNVLLFGRS